MRDNPASRLALARAALAVAALALLAALVVPYDNPSGEATGYALNLRDGGPSRVNPNHLLIEPVIGVIRLLTIRVADIDAMALLQWISRLTLIAYALLVLRIGSLLFAGASRPLAAATGCVSSLAILWFGTDGHPVLLAHLPWLLGAALHLQAWRTTSVPAHVGAGVAYGISVLVYISNVIPVGVIGLVSLVAWARRRGVPALIAPGIAAAVAGLGMVVAHAGSGSPLPLVRWITAYGGGTANLSYDVASPLSLLRAVFGFGNALIGARGAARLTRYWTEGGGSILPRPADAVELALWAAALAAAGWLTVLATARLRRSSGLGRAVLVVCLGSFVLVALFNYLWIGSHPHFWVPALPALWIAWAFGLGESRRRAIIVTLVCVAVLFPWNVFRTLRPLRGDPEPGLRRAELISRTVAPSLIVTGGLDWLDGFARYRGMDGRTVLSLWRLSSDPTYAGDFEGYEAVVDSTIAATLAEGLPVYVRGVIEEPFPDGVPWREMRPRGFPLDRIQARLARYPSRPAFTLRGQEYRELAPAIDSDAP